MSPCITRTAKRNQSSVLTSTENKKESESKRKFLTKETTLDQVSDFADSDSKFGPKSKKFKSASHENSPNKKSLVSKVVKAAAMGQTICVAVQSDGDHCRRSYPSSPGSYTDAKRYKHHQDPIALNSQTLILREHMYGDSDVVVVVKDHRFPVHKEILTDHSMYFRAMFTVFAEKDKPEVELKELVEPTLMAQAVHFMYFKNIYLTPKNVQDLLDLANYLQMEELQRTCCSFMRRRIDKHNCISLYLYTLSMGPYELQCHAEEFILKHFEHVLGKAKDFVHLSKDQFVKIISNERLRVSSEGAVYKAVLLWVGHNPRVRGPYLSSLLDYVHFPLMSLGEVEQFQRDSRVKKSKNLSIAFEEAKKYFDKDPKEKIE